MSFRKIAILVSLAVVWNFAAIAVGQLNESVSSTPFSTAGVGENVVTIAGDSSDDARLVEYERQLNALLRTRFNEEKLFVAQIVQQIGAQNISPTIVQTSFRWVLKKRPKTPNRFIYFERVLRLLAGKTGAGDAVPPFDPAIYTAPDATRDRPVNTSALTGSGFLQTTQN